VAFYVPLGPRGLLIGVGTFLHGIWGSLVYEAARRRRGLVPPHPPLLAALPDLMASD
jgi:hypothetical protein